MSGAAADLLSRCQASLQAAAAADASFQALAGGLQLLSRTKSLYSIMRKLLRLNDPAAGSRRLGQMYDLLGMRAVVLPRKDLPLEEAEAAAVQACYRLQVRRKEGMVVCCSKCWSVCCTLFDKVSH
jgi:(p)ppGpp synthase/HD superfamily hydrolase